MGTIREISKKDGTASYHAEVRIRGSTAHRASFRTRTLAKKWVQDIESAIRDRRHFRTAEAKRHTVAELIDRFIEQDVPKYPKQYQPKQKALLMWWRNELGHLLLADLVPSQIAECRDKLLSGITCRKSKRSGSTTNRYLAAFSKALGTALKEWGWIQDNPALKISKPQESPARNRFLSEEEIRRLLDTCKQSSNPYLHPIVSLALLSGMRHGELINLLWKNVCFVQKTITLETTKNGDRRVIPLTEEMETIFKKIPTYGSSGGDYVFKARYKASNSPVANIKHAFEKALKLAGIEKGFCFHLLRHTACSHMAMGGATQGELMALLGHRSPHMTARYRHYSQKHIAELMKRTQSKLLQEVNNEQEKQNIVGRI